MSVGNTNFQNQYTTDGTAGPWAFNWVYTEDIQVQVYLDLVLQSPSTYTITKDLVNPGGGVSFNAGSIPILGRPLLIQRFSNTLQNDVLNTNYELPPATIVRMADKLTIIAQQLSAQILRSLSLPLQVTGVSATLPAPVAGAIPCWNGAANAIQYIVPVQAGLALLDQGVGQVPTYGAVTSASGGNVVGPGTVIQYDLPLFANTSGTVLDKVGGLGTAGQFLGSNGPGAKPSMQNLPLSGLKSSTIPVSGGGRQLPTSGAISGEYVHYGNWTSTGPLTVAHGTKVFMRGLMTLAHDWTVAGSVTGGPVNKFSISSVGRGVGAPLHLPDNSGGYPGGAGAGCGGAGGNGGNTNAGAFQAGGVAYKYTDFFSGSSGGGGCSNGQTNTTANKGGTAGGAFYIETTAGITLTTGRFLAQGSNGDSGVLGAYDPGNGAGSGGVAVLRSGGTITLPANSVLLPGGNGGAAVSVNCGAGGGGGGGIFDAAAVTLAINGSAISVAGGAAGTGGSTNQNPTAGSTGTINSVTTALPVSVF